MSKSSYVLLRDYEEQKRIPREMKRLDKIINKPYKFYSNIAKKTISASNLIDFLHKGEFIDKTVKDYELPMLVYANEIYKSDGSNSSIQAIFVKERKVYFIDPFTNNYTRRGIFAQEYNMDPVSVGIYKEKGLDVLFNKANSGNYKRRNYTTNNKFFIIDPNGNIKEVQVKEKIEDMIGSKNLLSNDQIYRISNNYNKKIKADTTGSTDDILKKCIAYELKNKIR